MKTLTSMFVEQLKQAVTIAEKIEELETQLRGILTNAVTSEKKVTAIPTVVKPSTPPKPASKSISPEHRAKIAAAATARWAKVKGTSVAPAAKKKGGLTPEGRAKLAASMKARWAAKKKAAA